MSNFFVLGLPRSRTAWLANFLTYDDLFCYHEGVNGCKTINEYKEKIKGKGDSNTGIMLFDFENHFPDAKFIIIDSDIEPSINFGRNVFNTDIEHEMSVCKNRLDNINGLHINLADINNRLDEIWDYVSTKKFNADRADMLINLDIQVKDPLDIDFEAIKSFKETVNVCQALQ